jgi:hypothetical protein
MTGLPRKPTRKLRRDPRGFTRSTLRFPFRPELGERFDRVEIAYRPHGFWQDMVEVRASHDAGLGRAPRVEVNWRAGGRSPEEEPDDFVATRAFARALKDAMVQAEQLRRHMGIAEVNPSQIEEWKRDE